MQNISTARAVQAPPNLQNLQTSRVTARISASAAVAGLLASLAYGAARRDHDVLLWAVTADRVESASMGVAHG